MKKYHLGVCLKTANKSIEKRYQVFILLIGNVLCNLVLKILSFFWGAGTKQVAQAPSKIPNCQLYA